MKLLEYRKSLALGLVMALALSAAPVLSQGLPSADEIVAKYIAAVGGEKAIRSAQSMSMRGKMEMPAMGMTGEMSVMAAAPNKMLMVMELPGMGEVRTGYNGETAWVDNPMTGPMLMEGDQLNDLLRQADFYSDLNYEKNYPTRETLEKTEFAGQEAYKVRLVDTNEKELFEYFSTESGLKIGFEGEQTSDMGVVFVTTELSEYKDFDGRMVPTLTTAKMMGMEIKQTVDEMSFDDLDDTVFALPDNIKTLVEASQ